MKEMTKSIWLVVALLWLSDAILATDTGTAVKGGLMAGLFFLLIKAVDWITVPDDWRE